MPRQLPNLANCADSEEKEDRHLELFMSTTGKTTLQSLNTYDMKHQNGMSIHNTFPKGKPPLTLLHRELSLTEHAPSVRLRGKPPTYPVVMKRCFRFATLNPPESISQAAQLSTTSPVSLASFLPAPASDYGRGRSAAIPSPSSLLLPNSCQMTCFLEFPNSDLRAKFSPKTEGSSQAHSYHRTSKQKTIPPQEALHSLKLLTRRRATQSTVLCFNNSQRPSDPCLSTYFHPQTQTPIYIH